MHDIAVVMPYRLDLTVSVLRRLSSNVVDLLTPQGVYVRALAGFADPVIVRVALRRVAEALACGALDARALERRTSPDAAAMLQRIKGIGPWLEARGDIARPSFATPVPDH